MDGLPGKSRDAWFHASLMTHRIGCDGTANRLGHVPDTPQSVARFALRSRAPAPAGLPTTDSHQCAGPGGHIRQADKYVRDQVLGGIEIPVGVCATLRAHPRAGIEPLFIVLAHAVRAGLAARGKAVPGNHLPASPRLGRHSGFNRAPVDRTEEMQHCDHKTATPSALSFPARNDGTCRMPGQAGRLACTFARGNHKIASSSQASVGTLSNPLWSPWIRLICDTVLTWISGSAWNDGKAVPIPPVH